MRIYIFLVLFLSLLLVVAVAKKSQPRSGDDDISFSSPNDPQFQEYLDNANQRTKADASEELTAEERIKYQKEEVQLRKELDKVRQKYGRMSEQHVNALHALGRNIYKQQRYEEVYSFAQEIVKIHESIDGPEHLNTAKALTNVGSTANRLGKKKDCEIAMNRALYIFLKLYGENSKEVSNPLILLRLF